MLRPRPLRQRLGEVFRASGAAAGNYGNAHRIADGPRQRHVIALLRPVAVHGREQDLAGPARFDFPCPRQRVEFRVDAATAHIDIPSFTTVCQRVALAALGINRHHNTLAAKALGALIDDLRVVHRRTVDADLVGPGQQNGAQVIDRAQAAAHGKRDKDRVGDAAHHLGDDFARLVRCRYVKKHQLISTFAIVDLSLFNRITGIDKIDEIHALDDTAVLDVQAGNDAFC